MHLSSVSVSQTHLLHVRVHTDLMLFSEHYAITRGPDDDWFDPVLNNDTKLFLDPFLVFKEHRSSAWSGAHATIVNHFDLCFQLIAEGNCRPETIPYKKALDLLIFPEPDEICLGYTSQGIKGLGGGKGYARAIASAMVDAIERGKTRLSHFEELGIFNEGIGADRISDITVNILKRDFIAYTQRMAARHGLPLTRQELWASQFDAERKRWVAAPVDVLANPKTGGPLVLVPQRFLRELPQINDQDWWDWYENERLRDDVNYEVLGSVNKRTIVEIARRNPESVAVYMRVKEEEAPLPYDFRKDRKGVWGWYPATKEYVEHHPVQLHHPSNSAEFFSVIDAILGCFAHFVEERGGWHLLWNDDGTEKPEEAAQLLFRGIAEHYCKANGIIIDREVNLGRGPVDFKFSNGQAFRALLEIKKVHNSKFWNGLEEQLPSYLKSDDCTDGWFVAIQYREGGTSEARLKALPQRMADLRMQNPSLNVRYRVIDGQRKLSASKL